MPNCTHYWRIPAPDEVQDGPAIARCRKCGAERAFTLHPPQEEPRWRAYQRTAGPINGEVIA